VPRQSTLFVSGRRLVPTGGLCQLRDRVQAPPQRPPKLTKHRACSLALGVTLSEVFCERDHSAKGFNMRFLGDQRWQGVSAIASVGAFIVAYLAFTQPPQPPSSMRPETIHPGAVPTESHQSFATEQPLRPAPNVRATRTQPQRLEDASNEPEGGVSIVTSGFEGGGSELKDLVLHELQELDWNGLVSSGRKELRVTGSIRDAGLTLGQIPSAEGSASWELRSRSGAYLGQGGVQGRIGTGMDTAEARAAALRQIALKIAQDIVRENP
jgi:hypothetical protein